MQCAVCGEEQQCVLQSCAWESCNALNCPGCCDAKSCITDTTNDRCGRLGAPCRACAPDLACVQSGCGPRCSLKNCTGCCQGDFCSAGKTPDACGTGGGACKRCDAGQFCSGNFCF
jgi:hypothetical protein